MTRRARPEEHLQRQVVEYLQRAVPAPPEGPWFTHPHNEGRRSKAEAGVARAMGQKAGTPDLLLCYGGHLIGVELKAPGGRLTPAQQTTHGDLRAAGAHVYVARSLEDVDRILRSHGVPLKAEVSG